MISNIRSAVKARGDEYWISGVKQDGHDRHWAGSGTVEIDDDAAEEYARLVSRKRRSN